MRAKVGVDLVSVPRLQAILAELGPAFVDRTFTPVERGLCSGSLPSLAGRWAAKEAVLKVLGVGVDRLALLDIEVGRAPSGMPTLALYREAEEIAMQQGWRDWSVSISHEGDLATAVAIAWQAS